LPRKEEPGDAIVANAADVRQVKEAKKRVSKKDELLRADLKVVLSTVQGRRLVWRWLSECHTFRSVFSTDTATMAYLAGQQDIGHRMMAEIAQAHPDAYIEMMVEQRRGSA
jgi:hypothetical protein